MKANIIDVRKDTLPRYNNETNQDELTTMVVTTVEFVSDEGEVIHRQEYAQLPEEADPECFDRQAEAMQNDADREKVQEIHDEQEILADEKVESIKELIKNDNEPLKKGKAKN